MQRHRLIEDDFGLSVCQCIPNICQEKKRESWENMCVLLRTSLWRREKSKEMFCVSHMLFSSSAWQLTLSVLMQQNTFWTGIYSFILFLFFRNASLFAPRLPLFSHQPFRHIHFLLSSLCCSPLCSPDRWVGWNGFITPHLFFSLHPATHHLLFSSYLLYFLSFTCFAPRVGRLWCVHSQNYYSYLHSVCVLWVSLTQVVQSSSLTNGSW